MRSIFKVEQERMFFLWKNNKATTLKFQHSRDLLNRYEEICFHCFCWCFLIVHIGLVSLYLKHSKSLLFFSTIILLHAYWVGIRYNNLYLVLLHFHSRLVIKRQVQDSETIPSNTQLQITVINFPKSCFGTKLKYIHVSY